MFFGQVVVWEEHRIRKATFIVSDFAQQQKVARFETNYNLKPHLLSMWVLVTNFNSLQLSAWESNANHMWGSYED